MAKQKPPEEKFEDEQIKLSERLTESCKSPAELHQNIGCGNHSFPSLNSVRGTQQIMASSGNLKEWRQNLNMVECVNNGLPSFWYKEVMLSGVAGSFLERADLSTNVNDGVLTVNKNENSE